MAKLTRTVVVVPTYNEAANIERLLLEIDALNSAEREIKMLVVDDHSPDGTGEVVKRLAQANPKIELFSRKGKRGRGFAGIDGFLKAIRSNPDFVVEMDADFSHDPRYLPAMVEEAKRGFDVVIGSRFVPGGSDNDRGRVRQVITKMCGVYIRTLLGTSIRDVSSGYRLFRREVLESIRLDEMLVEGPAVLQEILFRVLKRGYSVSEIPIEFVDRRLGETKLSVSILLDSMRVVFMIRARDILGKRKTPT